MLATVQDLPVARKARKEEQVSRWKTGNKEGWIKYKEASKEASKKIDKVVEERDKDINEVVKKIESIETKVKFEVFGKCSTKSAPKMNNTNKEHDTNIEVEDEVKARQLLEMQTKRLDEELNKVKETGQSKASRIFKIAKLIKGLDNNRSKATAVKDPSTGTLIVDKDQIKNTTVKYCKEVLTKNKPKEGFIGLAKLKEDLHNTRMNERLGQGFMAQREVFDQIVEKFRKNNKRNYDFLVKSSEEFKEAIFKLCKRIIEEETIPDKFRQTTLHQVWKKKPGTKKEDLEANRFIHCKEWLPRAVESMVVAEMEHDIAAATSIYQALGFRRFCCSGSQLQNWALCKPSFEPKSFNSQKKVKPCNEKSVDI